MRALVTGAGGFLGRYIAEQLLHRGVQVRGLGRGDYPELRDLGVETISADIRDAAAVRAACRGVDCVFHAAAVAGIWGPWETFHEINTRGTEHVIEACREHGVRAVVYSSSPSVTFAAAAQEGIDESAPYPTHWLCGYPRSKALAEQAVLAADTPGQLRTCALRPHLIWGPRDQHLIPRLVQRAKSGRLRQVGTGDNLIDMIYVENAAEAHLLAADALLDTTARPAGNAYFISQGQPVNCWDWINEILNLAGLEPVSKSISLNTAWYLGGACEAIWRILRLQGEPPMTRFLAAQLGTSHYFDISAASRDFGFVPAVSTTEGMHRLATWLASGPLCEGRQDH